MSDMKLSEAIRLGAMNRAQAFFRFFRDDATCANGAALDACGLLDMSIDALDSRHNFALLGRFPIIGSLPRGCPECGYESYGEFKIAHLNDTHRWTREQIADWVETIERRAEADQVRTETETVTPSVSLVAQKA